MASFRTQLEIYIFPLCLSVIVINIIEQNYYISLNKLFKVNYS